MRISIQGIQEVQRANLRLIASLKPGGALEDAVRIGTIAAHRYAVLMTHVDTGALRASHRIKMERGLFSGYQGRVYIDPSAVGTYGRGNKRAVAKRPIKYGPVEHARGGRHAFYERVDREHGPSIARQSIAAYLTRINTS